MTDIDYSPYKLCVNNIVISNDLTNFKTNRTYNEILEHVSYNDGYGYFRDIINYLPLEQIKEYCNLNDTIGNPNLVNIEGIMCSPSSLRYIYFAYKIIQHFINQNITNPHNYFSINFYKNVAILTPTKYPSQKNY